MANADEVICHIIQQMHLVSREMPPSSRLPTGSLLSVPASVFNELAIVSEAPNRYFESILLIFFYTCSLNRDIRDSVGVRFFSSACQKDKFRTTMQFVKTSGLIDQLIEFELTPSAFVRKCSEVCFIS